MPSSYWEKGSLSVAPLLRKKPSFRRRSALQLLVVHDTLLLEREAERMKRAISIKLILVVLVGMLTVLLTDYHLQMVSAETNMVQNADLRIKQIEQIL